MYRSINAYDHGNKFADDLNATYKRYLKEQINLIRNSEINDSLNIVIISSTSNNVSVGFLEQYLKKSLIMAV